MSVLEIAGLDQAQETAYRTLLQLPLASGAELAENLGAAPAETTALLQALEAMGMVSVVPGTPSRFRATPPDLALGPLVHSREQELRDIRVHIARLTDEYRSRTAMRGAGEFVELLYGAKAIAQRFDQLQRDARKEVRGLVKSVGADDLRYDEPADGIRYRVIYDRELLTGTQDPLLLGRRSALGEEPRIAVDLPLKLVIADDDLALVPVADAQPGSEPSAILVHACGLMDALVALFETVWASSTPILVGLAGDVNEDRTGAEPTANDLRLLSLLLAGLTDQSIAVQLGLSTRTVQRRLHDLIKITGARTRVQLIWQATKRGWI